MADKVVEKLEGGVMTIPLTMVAAKTPAEQELLIKSLKAMTAKLPDTDPLKVLVAKAETDKSVIFDEKGNVRKEVQTTFSASVGGALGDQFFLSQDKDGNDVAIVGTGTADKFTVKAVVPLGLKLPRKPDGTINEFGIVPIALKDNFIVKKFTGMKMNPDATPQPININDPAALDAATAKVLAGPPVSDGIPAPKAPEPAALPEAPAPKPAAPAVPPAPALAAVGGGMSTVVTVPAPAAKAKAEAIKDYDVKDMMAKLLAAEAKTPEQKAALTDKVKKLVAALPEGKRAQFNKWMDDKAGPVLPVLNGDKIDPELQELLAQEFSDNMDVLKVTSRDGKESVVFGRFDNVKGELVIAGEIPAAAAKDGSMDAVKFSEPAKEPRVKGKIEGSYVVVDDAEAELLATTAATIETGAPPVGATPPGPTPGPSGEPPAVTGPPKKKGLGPEQGTMDKLANPATIGGGLIGAILGFFVGGPIGAILGLLIGGLGGNMMSGNSIFSDKQQVTVVASDKLVQVKYPEGNAPTIEMTLQGDTPGKKVMVKGKADDAGNFLISESVVAGPGQPPQRIKHEPPLSVPLTEGTYVDKDLVYKALNEKPPAPGTPDMAAVAAKPPARGQATGPGLPPAGGVAAGPGAGVNPRAPGAPGGAPAGAPAGGVAGAPVGAPGGVPAGGVAGAPVGAPGGVPAGGVAGAPVGAPGGVPAGGVAGGPPAGGPTVPVSTDATTVRPNLTGIVRVDVGQPDPSRNYIRTLRVVAKTADGRMRSYQVMAEITNNEIRVKSVTDTATGTTKTFENAPPITGYGFVGSASKIGDALKTDPELLSAMADASLPQMAAVEAAPLAPPPAGMDPAGARPAAAPVADTKPQISDVAVTRSDAVGGQKLVFTLDANTDQGKKKYRVEGKIVGATLEVSRITDVTNPAKPKDNRLTKPMVVNGNFFGVVPMQTALNASPEFLDGLANTTFPPAVAVAPAVGAEEGPAPVAAAPVAATVEVKLDAAAPRVNKEPTTYIVRGSDGKPMGAVVGELDARGDFVVTQYGMVDPKDPDKTLAPERLKSGPVRVDTKGGAVDFKAVMTEVRTQEDPVKMRIVGVDGGIPAGRDRKGAPIYTPVSITVEAGNGDKKQKFQLQGNVEGNTVRVTNIVGMGGDMMNPNLMVMGLDNDRQFTLPVPDLQKAKADLQKNPKAQDNLMTRARPMQRALVDFSAMPGKMTVAAISRPLGEVDLGNLAAAAPGGMRGGPGTGLGA